MIWSILGLLIGGIIVGALARLIVPGKQSMSWVMTMVLGVIGSFAGGLLTTMFTDQRLEDGLPVAGWIMSIVGAVIVLWIYVMATRRSARV